MKKTQILISLFLIIPVLILVIVREVKSEYVKLSIDEVHQRSLDESVFITSDNLRNNQTLIILNSSELNPEFEKVINTIPLESSELLAVKNRRVLNKLNEGIVLYCNDQQVAANTWVVLSSLGYKNIRIVTNKKR